MSKEGTWSPKQRLGQERAAAKEQRLKDMEVTFSQGSDPKAIRSGSVMILSSLLSLCFPFWRAA